MCSSVNTIKIDGVDYPETIDFQANLKTKLDFHHKQGWGYSDSSFVYNKKTKKISFTGSRYLYAGKVLPDLAKYFEENIAINFD